MFDRTFMVCTRALAPNILCPCPLCRRDAEIERLQRENTNLRNTARKSYDTVLQTMEANSASHRRVEEHGVATIRTLTAKLEEAEKRREQADRLAADVKACEEFLTSAGRTVVRVDGRIVGCVVPFGADLRGENKTLRDAMARDQEMIAELRAEIASYRKAAEADALEIAGLRAKAQMPQASAAYVDGLRAEIARLHNTHTHMSSQNTRLTAGCDTLRKQKEAADTAAYRLAGEVDDLTAKLEGRERAIECARLVMGGDPGHTLVLEGAQGTGKSTLVRAIKGELARGVSPAVLADRVKALPPPRYLKDIADRVGNRSVSLASCDWYPKGEPKIVIELRERA